MAWGYFEGAFGAAAFLGLRTSRFWALLSAMITSRLSTCVLRRSAGHLHRSRGAPDAPRHANIEGDAIDHREGSPMRATLHAVQPFELHGVRYYQFQYQGADGRLLQARLSADMAYPDPQPGDEVEVHAILGVVDGLTRVEA